MWNKPSQHRLKTIPALYETEHTPLTDKFIYLHFFIGMCDWFVAEHDGIDTCWGFVILNGDFESGEWGYFSIFELQRIRMNGWIEVDCELESHWKIRQASQVDKICQALGWQLEVV